jgi:hypothetical protein
MFDVFHRLWRSLALRMMTLTHCFNWFTLSIITIIGNQSTNQLESHISAMSGHVTSIRLAFRGGKSNSWRQKGKKLTGWLG